MSALVVGVERLVFGAENIRSRQRCHTNSCYFTMAAVDDDGRQVTVPNWRPSLDIAKLASGGRAAENTAKRIF